MSGQSSTTIANRALQILGAASILNLTDNSREARAASNCYDFARRAELRAHRWNFARARSLLAPSDTVPTFGYAYSFPLPSDCLYVPFTNDFDLDWQIEGRAILTNSTVSPWSAGMIGDGPELALVYIADIQDPTIFDPMFCEVLAARMAVEMCEELTQSNPKGQMARARYSQVLDEASSANAFEQLAADAPEDDWLLAPWR